MANMYKHKKTGNLYKLITATAKMQNSTDRDIEKEFENTFWTVYQSLNHKLFYIRPTEEFFEKFERSLDD